VQCKQCNNNNNKITESISAEKYINANGPNKDTAGVIAGII